MRNDVKKYLESRMLRKLHVRFGVGVGVQAPDLHHVRLEPRSNTAIAAGLSSFTNKKAQLHHQGFDQARGAGDPKKARKRCAPRTGPWRTILYRMRTLIKCSVPGLTMPRGS